MVNKKFGYIFNESAAALSEFEVVEKGKRVTAKGVVQTGNQQNRNGRRYRTEDLVREINAPRQRELLSTGNMLGEAGHPMSQDLLRQQTIDPKCVCVRYLKFWNEGDDIMAIYKGTNNELGDAFDQDLREGIKPAFSYRALGTVEETPQGTVVTNLKMITYDYVIYPSHPTAYTAGLITEASNIDRKCGGNLAKLVAREKLDGTKSHVSTFTNNDVINHLFTTRSYQESALKFIMDESKHYNLLKECFDITKAANIDLGFDGKIIVTESGIGTIVMDVEDYIRKEILTYTR